MAAHRAGEHGTDQLDDGDVLMVTRLDRLADPPATC